jgi:hypothetical protein
MLKHIGYRKFNEWLGYFSQIDQEVKEARNKGNQPAGNSKTMTLGGV